MQERHLTKRALDGWDSAAFSGFILLPSGILLSEFYLRPPTRK